jgi:hypothetical protein
MRKNSEAAVRYCVPAIASIIIAAASCLAQEVVVKPYNVYHAYVYDPTLIEEFRQGQMLEPGLTIDSIEVIDATRNGFGVGDLIVVYPSKQIYHLMTIEEPLRSIMSSWTYDANKLYSAPFTTSTTLLNSARELRSPYAGLLYFLVRGLELYYPGGDYIEGFFRRDPETSFIELWNFDDSKLNYREAQGLGISDTLRLFDILKVEANDTVFLTDSTLYDAIYIYKTIIDTVFVPQETR